MNMTHRFMLWALAVFALGFAPLVLAQSAPPPAAPPCNSCGTVESVRHIVQQGEASGAGAVIGGVAGGVLGHQIGSGRGNDAATVLGAVGGAYAGHQIEKNKNKKSSWQVRVRLDTGQLRTLSFRGEPAFREGDRVKIVNGRLALLAN